MTYLAYERCYVCSGFAQPGTRNLMGYMNLRFQWSASMGIYVCRDIAGTSIKSNHACGKAGDSKVPTNSNGSARTELGHQLVEFLDRYSSEFGITEQIYDRVRYSQAYPRGKYYGGVHPHNDHDHWSQTLAYAKALTIGRIIEVAGPAIGDEMALIKGNKGHMVAELQKAMKQFWGYDIGTWAPWPGIPDQPPSKSIFDGQPFGPGMDGDFGGTTESLVKLFQRNLGLPETGAADGVVMSAMFAKYGPAATGFATKTDLSNHSKAKAGGTVHPHKHDEGETGPAI